MSATELESGDGLLIIIGILVLVIVLMWLKIIGTARERIYISVEETHTQVHCRDGFPKQTIPQCVIVERHLMFPPALPK